MEDLADWLSLAALVAALLALTLGFTALRRSSRAVHYQRWRSRRRRISESRLPTDVRGLRAEVEALRQENSEALRHLSVVRYDAFGDMGGHLSWSAALLDDHGNGLVLTSIHGRSESRTYAKNVAEWSSDQTLSPEEEEAIDAAHVAAE
ncbi:MAG: DUF4446 family protein [Actinomycetota bacterium]|nr:DUF4446 family protein [Actinomycetota bacterium]